MDHHPTIGGSARYGYVCRCACRWHSAAFTTISGAHLAFAAHLLAYASRQTETAAPAS